MVCSIRTPIKIHTSTQQAYMTNIMNELVNMRIADINNINDHVI